MFSLLLFASLVFTGSSALPKGLPNCQIEIPCYTDVSSNSPIRTNRLDINQGTLESYLGATSDWIWTPGSCYVSREALIAATRSHKNRLRKEASQRVERRDGDVEKWLDDTSNSLENWRDAISHPDDYWELVVDDAARRWKVVNDQMKLTIEYGLTPMTKEREGSIRILWANLLHENVVSRREGKEDPDKTSLHKCLRSYMDVLMTFGIRFTDFMTMTTIEPGLSLEKKFEKMKPKYRGAVRNGEVIDLTPWYKLKKMIEPIVECSEGKRWTPRFIKEITGFMREYPAEPLKE